MRRALFPFMCLWAMACRGSELRPNAPVLRRDSAGVEIVSNLGDESALPLDSASQQPLLVIETAESGGVVLDRISAVVPLDEGRIAVGSQGASAVYIFDAEGVLVTSLGRAGDGPGEFRAITGVVRILPDSLAVLDNRLGRLTVFSGQGAVARSVDVSRFLPPARGAELLRLGDDLALVGVATVGANRRPGAYRDSADSYRLDTDGDSLAFFGSFPGAEVMYAERLFGVLPFGTRIFGGAWGDLLIVGFGSEPELREYGPSGSLNRLIRWPDHARQVTEERVAAFIDFQLETAPEEQRAVLGEMIRDLPHAPRAPAYFDLTVSDEGVIWLGDYPGPEAFLPEPAVRSRVWTLITLEGVRRRRVWTPPGFRVRAVVSGRAFGVQTDELGVETIAVYEVPPP